LGKFGKVVEGGDNRKWLKTDPKPNLLTITTVPPPYISLIRHPYSSIIRCRKTLNDDDDATVFWAVCVVYSLYTIVCFLIHCILTY